MIKKFLGLSIITILLPFFAQAEIRYSFLAPIPGFEDIPPGSPLLAYLVDMNGQMIRLDANAVATLSDSDPDRGEQNRTTSVDVLEMFGAYWFIDKMWPQLESVEVLN